jgi:hypothetical protein
VNASVILIVGGLVAVVEIKFDVVGTALIVYVQLVTVAPFNVTSVGNFIVIHPF